MKTKDLGNKRIMSENIKRHLSQRGLNVKDFSIEMGFKYTTVLDWVNAKTYPRIDKIELMARYFNVDKSDLVEEYNPIKEKQSTTKQILDNVFSKLETNRQDKVVSYAQSELVEQNKENLVQLFPYNVKEKLSAGTGYGYFDDGNSDTVYYNKQYDYDFASWIFGDSMLPDYPNGDVALIKACPFEYDGCVYAVDWDGQSYIKKVYKEEKGLRLVSTNEKYSDKFAPYSEEPRIIGKVVASFTPLEK
ncbi:LexA family transcriptional regulator [Lactococcus raffinolactis]|uniref:LexA family transcriptional regulator n=1 Tax=Pseudolactococcus raffinolactis TaxID=1366 RepID=UPI001437087E|nr:XRE family transcriptional regulator [Lactococcus raffinolactis]QIW51150.1 helix-turn-helix domain-containing protein [Lactococcus raffinolactis]